MFNVTRDPRNPLINPDPTTPWLAEAAFNPSPVIEGNNLHLVFRAATRPSLYRGQVLEQSTIGIATSTDHGATFGPPRQLIVPEEPWELYGCEDPRVTKIGDTYYIFYTALSNYPFDANDIKVAVATTKDLKTIEAKHLVTPFNAKAMALFPEREGGKLRAILTVDSDRPPSKIAIIEFDKPEDIWSPDFWQHWLENLSDHTLDLKRSDTDHIEVGAPPIWTKDGWLLVYSHIQNYFSDDKIFGIEAALLDLKDPTKVLKRTMFPFMVPEEGYERYNRLPKIIFPSGSLRHGDQFTVYYGSTDTGCCRATLSFSGLLESMSADGTTKQYAQRVPENPILEAITEHPWESRYVLNPAAIELDGTIHILYRALGEDNTSVIGYARSKDGVHIEERLPLPIYSPRANFEQKHGGPNEASGCEDARIVRIGDRLHITYTAYDSITAPQIAQSSISVSDFLARNFDNWTAPALISPEGIDDKDAAIFPEKVNGRYMILHRVSDHVCADYVDSLDFHKEKVVRCIQMFGPRKGMWDSQKVGIAGPPVKTAAGWLLFYHGITTSREYCLGAVLLDRKNPTRVLGRTAQPIMTPIKPWEREGWINNVVFPCGQVVRDDTIYLYYGGADAAIGVATLSLSELVSALRHS
jgi:beta-1,2-mannobiose phosphorylase / 1,2-beta-oligomannan phosphorylase